MGLAKRLIPCLDIDNGRVVKGVNFVNIRDAGNPVEIAKRYNDENADELVFLDITASHQNRNITLNMVSQIASQVFIPLTIGGGIRNCEDIRRLLNAGADKIAINSAAVNDIDFVAKAAQCFGSQCIVVAIDCKQVCLDPPRWQIFTHGGRHASNMEVISWAQQLAQYGAGEILLTSMDRDGTKTGFDITLIRAVSRAVDLPIIASGGVGNLADLAAGILQGEADAVLAASIFHFGTFSIQQAKQYLSAQGIEIRL